MIAEDGRRPTVASIGRPDGERINDLYRRLSPGVMFVQARITRTQRSRFGPPRRRSGISTGTGFVIDEQGHVVTNAHVVENAEKVRLLVEGEQLIPATVVGSDLSTDLAVLKVDPDDVELAPLELASSSEVRVGDPVLAIGNPFGLEDTVTSGIVSARQRRITAPDGYATEGAIQTDAAVNPGNSGGPLVDLEGRVIGVNSQIATGGVAEQSAGIGFAVPADTVREIVPDLLDDGTVTRPFLGVSTIEVTDSMAQALRIGVERGAYVVAVADDSPADRAGIRAAPAAGGALVAGGDVIVRVGDRPIETPDDVAQAVLDDEVGDRIEVVIVRDGERQTMTVTLGTRPAS
jgi:S1-C subfamily serine protease